MQAATTQK